MRYATQRLILGIEVFVTFALKPSLSHCSLNVDFNHFW